MTNGTRIDSEIIQIGNSQGVRIPKSVLEQCQLRGEITMEIREDELVLRASKQPRKGWEEAFAKAKREGDDVGEFLNVTNDWDKTEWTW